MLHADLGLSLEPALPALGMPLLLVLAAAPGMLRRGASPGDIVGAVTYVAGSLRGVLDCARQSCLGIGGVHIRRRGHRLAEIIEQNLIWPRDVLGTANQ